MLPARYLAYCPNCGGPITEERLEAGLACERCQPDPALPPKPGRLKKVEEQKSLLAEWEAFFREKHQNPPWPLQRTWAARVVAGRSFAMLAPTGIGKTTFGLITAAWLAERKKRSHLIFPTRLLVRQASERLAALGAPFLAYNGKKKEKEAILRGEAPILVYTVQFLYKNRDALPRPVDFLFVDDVDSVLKSARNVDALFSLLGFSPRDIELAFKNIYLRQKDPRKAEERAQRLRKKAKGVLAVASATARPRSARVKLFRELLGFEVSAPSYSLRKVADVYEEHFGEDEEALFSSAAAWAKRLGGGGLFFLSGHRPKEDAERFKEFLAKKGVTALTYEDEDAVPRFKNGEVDYLIGFASWRNPLARGLDLPQRVRYALFVGVPRLYLPLADPDPEALLRVAVAMLPLLDPALKAKVRRLARAHPPPEKELKEVAAAIEARLNDPEFRAQVEKSPEVGLRFDEEGRPVLVFADVTGYLQASGRTSRLTPAGLTQGLALTLAEDEKAWNALYRRLSYLLDEPPKPVAEVELEEILKKIDEDRLRLARGETRGLELSAQAVVVESPNKARTIASFFGRPQRRYLPGLLVYEVLTEDRYLVLTATRGHVTDLALRGGLFGVETDGHYRPRYHPLRQCPEGAVPDERCPGGKPSLPDRDQALLSLEELALEVGTFYLATDPDTEGEKIARDVELALAAFAEEEARAEFHAVTPRAFAEALANPREVDKRLVAAQKVRRVADRWVGFSLSQGLWELLGRRTLSAGRVQTPVLGWVIERAKLAEEKEPRTEVEISGLVLQFPGEVLARELLVEKLAEREEEKNPRPPFTTDSLLAEAAREGFSVPRAMELAQDLFEAGYITYHRTDSTRVSPEGMALAKRLISERYGPEYVRLRPWGEGGAHEAIRPARPMTPEDLEELILFGTAPLEDDHLKLYELVFRRFLASQMIPARVLVALYRFVLGEASLESELITRVLEPGFTLAWPLETSPEPPPGRHPVSPRVVLVPKAKPYTEGELVAEMKRRGLGRPSTYAVIVEKLLERRYVVRRGPYLHPTPLGERVYRLLTAEGPLAEVARRYVSEEFTRELEAWMDRVEEGEDPEAILRTLEAATREILGVLKSHNGKRPEEGKP